jgi:hypothetical protein
MPPYRLVCLTAFLIVLTLVSSGPIASLAIQKPRIRQTQSRRSSDDKPLTNADVVRMSKNGFSDDAIITTIHNNKTKFDLSVDALIALKNAGITERVISVMQAGQGMARVPQSRSAVTQEDRPAPPAVTTSPPRLEQPYVLVVLGGKTQPLPLEPTRVGKAEAKGDSLGDLAKEQATDKLYNAVELSAATRLGIEVDTRLLSIPLLGPAVGIGSAMMGGIGKLGRILRKPKPITYLWAVPGRRSSLGLRTGLPQFEVVYGEIPGIDPDDYEPFVVRLMPTRENWRLVGAKKDDPEAYKKKEWSAYSEFIEERIPIRSNRIGRGHFALSLERLMEGGEYGVVLRPTSRSKVFSGDDIASRKNSGVLFDTVWSFSVAP